MRATLAPARPADAVAAGRPLQLAIGLVAAIWVAGLAGHFTPLAEWPALFIYVLGGLAAIAAYCRRYGAWGQLGITRAGLGRALVWGGAVGGVLMLIDMANTWIYYRGGGAPLAEMEQLLVGMRLAYLFPLLVLAEEWLWRGLLFSALLGRGVNRHLVVLLTTALYMVNHYAVAPVPLGERTLMAIMALPIGLLGGYLVLRTRSVWSSVALHMLVMISMLADVFILPALAR